MPHALLGFPAMSPDIPSTRTQMIETVKPLHKGERWHASGQIVPTCPNHMWVKVPTKMQENRIVWEPRANDTKNGT